MNNEQGPLKWLGVPLTALTNLVRLETEILVSDVNTNSPTLITYRKILAYISNNGF